jgi:hypothetical protein
MHHKYSVYLFSLLILFFLCSFDSYGQQEGLLEKLTETIKKAPEYDAVKLEKIDSLRQELQKTSKAEIRRSYEINHELLKEFKVFNQDSAFVYGLKTKKLSEQLDSLPLIAEAVVDLADVSVAAGMYKETLDFLNMLDPQEIPANLRSLYFGLLGRVYSEMAEYSNLDYFSKNYNNLAAEYRQKALSSTDEGTFFHSFLDAFIRHLEGEDRQSLSAFNDLLAQELSAREKALVHYLLGDIYESNSEKQKAIKHFAEASIIDVQTSTKETLAIIRLSELLFETGDIRNASVFIQKANADAAFYGAQHRKIQVGAILPLIEESVIQRIEKQRQRLYTQNVIVSLLLLFVLALAVVIYLQVRRLKGARKTILEAHENLQLVNSELTRVNEEIQSKNAELSQLNSKLLEANKIKEEYIGFFFTHDADIFEQFREFKSRIEKDLEADKIEKAKYTLSRFDLKKEKEKLLKNFDEAFIKLFPNFIKEFNSLLKPEEQIKLKKGQLLNKELRIFALMRLGINHNEVIAQILGYSVNSIYAYKTKIRKKSVLDKQDFDQQLVENTTLKL